MFCVAREIEDSYVTKRAIQIWNNILKMQEYIQPSSRSYSMLQEQGHTGQYDFVKASFFASTVNLLNAFLTVFKKGSQLIHYFMVIVILSQGKSYPGLLNQPCLRKQLLEQDC